MWRATLSQPSLRLSNQVDVEADPGNRSRNFVFDSKRSSVLEAEVNAIANIESEEEPQPGTKIGGTTFYSMSQAKAFVGGGYEVFLKYNPRSLMKIARGRESKQKAWLRQFLSECADTPEKRTLLAALQQK